MKFKLILLFFLIPSCFLLSAQEKKYLYVLFDEEIDVQMEGEEEIRFYIQPSIHSSFFVFKRKKNEEKVVSIKEYRDRLFTKEEANEIFFEIMEEKAKKFEEKTGLKGNMFRNPPYYYNSVFDDIYLYKEVDAENAILYQVDWMYAIE